MDAGSNYKGGPGLRGKIMRYILEVSRFPSGDA